MSAEKVEHVPVDTVDHVSQPNISQAAAQGARLEDAILKGIALQIENIADVTQDAHQGVEEERRMSVRQAVRLYPKAVFFSVVLSLSLIMEGYDTSLLGGFFGYPAFQEKFGVPYRDGYQLTSSWQSGLQAAVQVGEIVGLWIGGTVAERYGYRKTMIGALAFMIGAIFIMFFAQNIVMLFFGEILCGLPWGAFQAITTTYAADISPPALRPYLTSFNNMCWVIGQTISSGVLRGCLHMTGQWGWRIPYATQWVWPIPIILGCLLAPESPLWLVRHDRVDDARGVLKRLLSTADDDESVDRRLATMIYTNAHEKAVSAGTHWRDCFRGTDLRRTEITCCAWLVQIGCGAWFVSITYFLEQAGFSPANAFSFNLGNNAVGIVGTICAWWAMEYVGRRRLYLTGLCIMLTILIVVGFMGIPAPTSPIAYATGSMLYIFNFTYAVTVGPVCYVLVAEMPSTRQRIKTVALARNAYNIVSIAANFLQNPILNPTAWNLRGKGGFIWAFFCAISLAYTYFRIPETKGRSPGEMDVLFESQISARKFASTHVDEFSSDNLMVAKDADALVAVR